MEIFNTYLSITKLWFLLGQEIVPDLKCQSIGLHFKTKCAALLNDHRDTQRSTHGTQNECLHTGTAPVTYRPQKDLTRSSSYLAKRHQQENRGVKSVTWLLPVLANICMYVCVNVCMQKNKLYRPFQHKNTRRNDTVNGDKAHIPKGKVKLKLLQHCT